MSKEKMIFSPTHSVSLDKMEMRVKWQVLTAENGGITKWDKEWEFILHFN